MPADNTTPSQDINITITRVPSGVQIAIKAEIFEQFFSQLSCTSNNTPNPLSTADRSLGGAVRVYQFTDRERDGLCIPGSFYELGTGRLIDTSGNINLAVLTVVGTGLATGVTFIVKTVMSKTQLKLFTQGLDRLIRSLYTEFMQPEVNTIEFNIRHLTS